MSTTIGSTKVATPEDISQVQERVDYVWASLTAFRQETQQQLITQEGQIGTLRAETRDLQTRTGNLEGAVLELDEKIAASIRQWKEALDQLETQVKDAIQEWKQTQESIAGEMREGTTLLAAVNQQLTEHGEAMTQMAAMAQEQAQTEAGKRQTLAERLEQVLQQQQLQTTALREAFGELHTQFGDLARTEERGARQVEDAIQILQAAMAQAKKQMQDALARSAATVDSFAGAKTERAQREAAAFDQLRLVQDRMAAQLAGIETVCQALAASGQMNEAEQQARSIQVKTWQAAKLNREAAGLLRRGDHAAAMGMLEEAARLAPEEAAVKTNLALACLGMHQAGRAESLLREVLERDATFVAALNGWGLLCLDRSDAPAAVPSLKRAVELMAEDAGLWLNLGKAYYGSGAVAPAMEAWRRAQMLEPELVAAEPQVSLALAA